MPPSAYGLVAVFAAVSLAAGILVARVIGPWRWWSPILPALAAFGALYLVGHRLVVSIGPEVALFGWDVALPFDIAVALAAAGATAAVQTLAGRLLQPQQRDPGGDGLA